MKSDKPKVLHQVAGQSMLAHVVSAGNSLEPTKIQVVVGFGADQIQAEFGADIDYVIQDKQLGTGHAVQCAASDIDDDSVVLVLYGDVPLVQPDTLNAVVESAKESGLALLSVSVEDPTGYGRILRDEYGTVRGIIEHKDATFGQLDIKEINTGILAGRGALLKNWLSLLSSDNAAGEYYLTDVVAMAVEAGVDVQAVQPTHFWEVAGANSRQQLVELERRLQRVSADRLLEQDWTLCPSQRRN
eukprot:g4442.t1